MNKLSIITINYNNAADLRETIKSVLEQTWTGFEYIIIDGGSTDGSVEIIKQHQERIAYWVSEPDKGIFNAMNKGIEKATGEYLLMLNAGDVLHSRDTLEQVFGKRSYTEEVLYGNAVLESNGKVFGTKVFSEPVTFDFFRKTSLSHQACFIKRELHDRSGLYDEALKYSSDWKFLLLAFCKYNVRSVYLDLFLATCNCDGLTWSPRNFKAMRKEMNSVLDMHFPGYVFVDQSADEQGKWFGTGRAIISSVKGLAKKGLKKIIPSL
ncbi:glycosyltransferase family 2 protein [Paraflavisolibacter sp. H34]|uniref:glycosyltransferase family 2 protein n=1 Tax=Huijunlia imazamoxiresistens TaxID=3127457 RepID=UPI003019C88B